MKKTFFFAATFAAMALTSCNNDNEQAQTDAKPEYITVSTSIGALTRVANNGNTSAFEDGDKISVYACSVGISTQPVPFRRVFWL